VRYVVELFLVQMGAGAVLLTGLAFLDKVGAVLIQCWSKVSRPEDSCRHCFGAGVVSVGAFMYLLHDVECFVARDAPE